ncbi:hypothetical protein [Nonlabens xiamenensis]|uniref:hypothetical protein n=1 Tax=Nonlabens xiamenensis TaxID=2341043 RepID=UPI000F60B1F5|nr:hypothetical protein [Nonlabens xiamenensis]
MHNKIEESRHLGKDTGFLQTNQKNSLYCFFHPEESNYFMKNVMSSTTLLQHKYLALSELQ